MIRTRDALRWGLLVGVGGMPFAVGGHRFPGPTTAARANEPFAAERNVSTQWPYLHPMYKKLWKNNFRGWDPERGVLCTVIGLDQLCTLLDCQPGDFVLEPGGENYRPNVEFRTSTADGRDEFGINVYSAPSHRLCSRRFACRIWLYDPYDPDKELAKELVQAAVMVIEQ